MRDPANLPQARVPETPVPRTVTTLAKAEVEAPEENSEWAIPLDEALQVALENSEVVRVLAGVSAVSSGSTIYDPAIANAAIDEQQGRFDPNLQWNNNFDRSEQPLGILDPSVPSGARISGGRTDDYQSNLDLSKTNPLGGTTSLRGNLSRSHPALSPLDPQTRGSLELSYVQPLLRGGGIGPNTAPIVLARIETERSFFQFKDSVQELVRGMIDAYWALVSARTDVWAREQQVAQGQEAYDRELARLRRGLGDQADVAQARLALADFRAALIGSRANQLNREAALLNIMGLPPTHPRRPIPTTPPTVQRIDFDWNELVQFAQQRRPDLIELKLILEADAQQLAIAENEALPNVDAVMLYRWNGLEGETPTGTRISSESSQFTDWSLGINFSVPLGLRQSRAALRRQELLIARDRANLQQGLHSAIHVLAGNLRNLDQTYEQYEAFKETRLAARDNLEQQISEQRRGRVIFLNVLQAINSWGNAVSAEAERLTQYNTELANLERQTGSILETHGIRFYEERECFAGPLGILGNGRDYPAATPPATNSERYPPGTEPAENFFDLSSPVISAGADQK